MAELTAVMIAESKRLRAQAPCRLVELVGPAGAGKSTLATTLPMQDPNVIQGPNLWGLPRALLAASAVELTPTILAAAAAGRPLRGDEMGQMVRIGALRRALERVQQDEHCTVIIDEGAVFGLAWLEVFHPADDDAVRAAWRSRERAHWADRLHAVVRLDAADGELAQRIRTRAKQHMMKDCSDAEIQAFMDRFRDCYDDVLTDMSSRGRITVRSMRNGDAPMSERVTRLREAIEDTRHG
jgi:hypothetical protein